MQETITDEKLKELIKDNLTPVSRHLIGAIYTVVTDGLHYGYNEANTLHGQQDFKENEDV